MLKVLLFISFRITESQTGLGWKGPLKIVYFQLSWHEQGHLPLDKSPIQTDVELFQLWSINKFSGKSLPVYHHLHGKYIYIYLYLKNIYLSYIPKETTFSLKLLTLILLLQDLVKKKSLSICLINSL